MKTYIVKRTGQMLLIFMLISIFTLILALFIPGDSVCVMLGEEVSQEEYNGVYHELKLDQPVTRRYLSRLEGAVWGDWGQSIQFHRSTLEVLNERIPITMFFSLSASAIGTSLGILFGAISAIYRGQSVDTAVTLTASITACLPQFWIAPLVMYILAMKSGWLSSYGFTWFPQDLSMGIRQTIMPLFCLALGDIATIIRQTHSSMLEVTRQDYVRTAKSKGLSGHKVVYIHALKNILIPVITVLGMRLGSMLAGSMFVESVLNIPGMGSLFVKAIQSHDTLVIQACVLVTALAFCTINSFMDILYVVADPRVHYE